MAEFLGYYEGVIDEDVKAFTLQRTATKEEEEK